MPRSTLPILNTSPGFRAKPLPPSSHCLNQSQKLGLQQHMDIKAKTMLLLAALMLIVVSAASATAGRLSSGRAGSPEEISAASTTFEKIRAANLGGWLVIEKWIKPELFDGIPNKDLLDGTQIQLKSVKLGTFICAEGGGGGKLVVNRQSASDWETFKLWRVSSRKFQLRVFNNKFVSSENGGGGEVTATRDTPSTWETFQIVRKKNSNLVHLKALNGQFLQAKDQSQLTADYSGQPGWDNNGAVFEMNVTTVLGGEYQLANGYGSKAPQIFKNHRDTFITENDFKFLASQQINAVRVPVGWWIAYDPNPPAPFVAGSLQALDNVFQWGQAHNIKIIVDLHAAPGSQNPWEHSGNRDGVTMWTQSDYISQTLKVIDFLASRYAKNPALLGIELLNEPRAADVSLDTLNQYYINGYQTVRKHSSSAYVIFCQRIGADPSELVKLMTPSAGYQNVVLDVHFYNLFTTMFDNTTPQWNIDYINNERRQSLQSLSNAGGASIFVGEWTNEWAVEGASDSDYANFGTAQLNVYGEEASFGWSYWCLRNDKLHWDFEKSVNKAYLRHNSNGGWPS